MAVSHKSEFMSGLPQSVFKRMAVFIVGRLIREEQPLDVRNSADVFVEHVRLFLNGGDFVFPNLK